MFFKRALIFVLMMFACAGANLLHAQSTITVKGQVTDEMGPLPGVTVLVKGNSMGGVQLQTSTVITRLQ